MSVRISLSLEAKEMFMFLHTGFSLERAYPGKYLLFGSFTVELTDSRYLKLVTSSSIWLFILISLGEPLGLFVIIFVLSGPISTFYLGQAVPMLGAVSLVSSFYLALTKCHM